MCEIRNYRLEEIKRKHKKKKIYKKTCATFIYIEHLFILASTVTGCVSSSDLSSLVGILVGIVSFALELKTCAITARIKKHKSLIKKK